MACSPFNCSRLALQQIDPRENRDEVVDLFVRNGRSDFVEHFEWSLAPASTISRAWCLRSPSDLLVGFLAVFERIVNAGTQTYRLGVPGDLLIDGGHRSIKAVSSLIRAPQELVNEGEIDVVLVSGGVASRRYKGERTSRLIQRLGYQSLGMWQTCVLPLKSRSMVSRRFGMLGALSSPLLDLRSLYKIRRARVSGTLDIQELSEGTLAGIGTCDWGHHPQLSVTYPSHQLAWRFLGNPAREGRRILGIMDRSRKCLGYVAASMSPERTLRLHQVQVDHRYLTERDAIVLLARDVNCDAITVNLLERSSLIDHFKAIGFFAAPPAGVPLVGYWKPSQIQWGNTASWRLFQGFTDI